MREEPLGRPQIKTQGVFTACNRTQGRDLQASCRWESFTKQWEKFRNGVPGGCCAGLMSWECCFHVPVLLLIPRWDTQSWFKESLDHKMLCKHFPITRAGFLMYFEHSRKTKHSYYFKSEVLQRSFRNNFERSWGELCIIWKKLSPSLWDTGCTGFYISP